jgi:hypothetical protein
MSKAISTWFAVAIVMEKNKIASSVPADHADFPVLTAPTAQRVTLAQKATRE